MVSASQRRIRIAILTIGISAFLFSLLFPGWARYKFKHDHDDAPPQRGTATVEQVVPSVANQFSGQVEKPMVEVRFRNQTLIVRKPKDESEDRQQDISRLHVGSQAQIVYRVGRSGRVYVDSVEPLPEDPRRKIKDCFPISIEACEKPEKCRFTNLCAQIVSENSAD